MPTYSPEYHPSLSVYLSAVETILRDSTVDEEEQEQILQSIIEQFEASEILEGEKLMSLGLMRRNPIGKKEGRALMLRGLRQGLYRLKGS